MNKIKEHVVRLFRDIPDSERKAELIQEITENLEEKVLDLMEQGKSEEDARNKVIVEFSDIEEIKQELGISRTPLSGGWNAAPESDWNRTQQQPKSRRNNKQWLNFCFAVWGWLLIVLLCVFINLYYSPQVIWFIYPMFGVMWWPLALYYHWKKSQYEGG